MQSAPDPTTAPYPAPRPLLRRVVLALVGGLVLAGLGGGTLAWRHHEAWKNFAVVEEGGLYRSGRLSPEILARAIETHGLRTVVDLTPATGEQARLHEEERRVCEAAGIRYLEIPMGGRDVPRPEQVERWLALLDDRDSLPILVHCKHGVHRTGMLVAVFEMEARGVDNEQALADLPLHGHDMKPAMRELILGHRPSGRVTAGTRALHTVAR